MPETEQIFRNRRKAWQELKRQKFKVAERTFYLHCTAPGQTNGKCKVEKDGTVTQKALDRYISKVLVKKEDPDAGLASKKQEKEVERITAQTKLLQMECEEKEGKLISKIKYEQDQAGLALLLVVTFRNIIKMGVPDNKLRNKLLEETKNRFNKVITQNREYFIICNDDATETT